MPSPRKVAACFAVMLGLLALLPAMRASADQPRYVLSLGNQAAMQPGGVLAQVPVTWACPVDTDSERSYSIEVTLAQSPLDRVVHFSTQLNFPCDGRRHSRAPLLLPVLSGAAGLRPGSAFLSARMSVTFGRDYELLTTADRVVQVEAAAPASDPNIAPIARLQAAGAGVTGSVRSRCEPVALIQRLPDGTVQVGEEYLEKCAGWTDVTWIAPARAWTRGPATAVLQGARQRFATIRVR